MTTMDTWENLYARAASGAGSHRGGGNSSLSALLSSLIPFFLISAIVFVIFVVAQTVYKRVYEPRTYLESLQKDEQTPERSAGLFGFTKELRRLTDEYVLEHSSLDNYLWLRFFKMLTLMSFVGCLVTWPILFPVNATGGADQGGLDILSFSNINPGPRYLAQCFVAWIFLAFVMFLITRETMYFVHLRQAYFLSPFMTSRISSKTVLFLDVPETHRDEDYVRRIFPGARTVWTVKNTEELEDHIEERDDAAVKLETGETALIKNYTKRQIKAGKKGNEDGQEVAEVHSKDRPTHKTKPIIGQKVDTVNWARGELQRLIPQVAQEQNARRSNLLKTESALFIEFENVSAAQAAFQQVAHRNALRMTPTDIGMTPDNVIWKNLGKPWYIRKAINWASTAFVVFLCLFWTIPVTFVGVITNITYLTNRFTWLEWIDAIPSQVKGVITGLLPTILLVILMALVPIICNLLAGLFEPTQSAVQLRTQAWYFPFQVIQVFLITTFASGAASVGSMIASNPTQAPTLLARNLPKASNFYLSYFIYFGLLQAAVQILNVAPLLFFAILGKFTDKTPRKMFNRYISLPGLGWGALYPKFTNLGVIALSYSSIAPLILGFATIAFGLLYLAFRYNMFFTMGTAVSTRGRAYARALQQLTVGIYLSEICLIGLFAIGTGSSIISVAALILMVIFLVGTIFWHVQMRKVFGQLTSKLPADLLAEEYTNLHDQADDPEKKGANGRAQDVEPNGSNSTPRDGEHYQIPKPQNAEAPALPSGISQRVKAFFLPTKYSSAATLSKHVLSPHLAEPVRPYTDEERREAYVHPALLSECQVIWIPKDSYGLSQREIADTKDIIGEGLTITDEATWIDEKGNIQWTRDQINKVPIWEDEVVY